MATEQNVIVVVPEAEKWAKKSWAKKLTRIDTGGAHRRAAATRSGDQRLIEVSLAGLGLAGAGRRTGSRN